MAKTIAEVAVQIAEAVMDTIEQRRGILKDDITEAARAVLAKNQNGSPYLPHMGMMSSMFPPPPADVSPASVNGCLAPDGTVLTVGHLYRVAAAFKGMDAAFDAARHDMVAYGSSVVRVNGDGSVEHVKLADWNDADDGKIWSLPNGSP